MKLIEREENPVDVNVTDDIGCTPLIYSARAKDPKTIKHLLEKGADINHKGFGGMTALHHACNLMHEASIHVLVEGGADLNVSARAVK